MGLLHTHRRRSGVQAGDERRPVARNPYGQCLGDVVRGREQQREQQVAFGQDLAGTHAELEPPSATACRYRSTSARLIVTLGPDAPAVRDARPGRRAPSSLWRPIRSDGPPRDRGLPRFRHAGRKREAPTRWRGDRGAPPGPVDQGVRHADGDRAARWGRCEPHRHERGRRDQHRADHGERTRSTPTRCAAALPSGLYTHVDP